MQTRFSQSENRPHNFIVVSSQAIDFQMKEPHKVIVGCVFRLADSDSGGKDTPNERKVQGWNFGKSQIHGPARGSVRSARAFVLHGMKS